MAMIKYRPRTPMSIMIMTTTIHTATIQTTTIQTITIQTITFQTIRIQPITIQTITVQTITVQTIAIQTITTQTITVQTTAIQTITTQKITIDKYRYVKSKREDEFQSYQPREPKSQDKYLHIKKAEEKISQGQYRNLHEESKRKEEIRHNLLKMNVIGKQILDWKFKRSQIISSFSSRVR